MSNTFIAPPPMQHGDAIGIVATGGKLAPNALAPGLAVLHELGLQALPSPQLEAGFGYFAGPDQQRLQQLQAMLDHPQLKAIVCARGGYGTTRILDRIDWTGFRKHPKWLIGFSDITALHLQLHQMGYLSVHGPTLNTLRDGEPLRALLFEGKPPVLHGSAGQMGTATAPLVGGNLCMLAQSIGSASDVAFDGKILFLEEVGEPPYRVDRYLNQLHRAGKFKHLAGLVVGDMGFPAQEAESFGISLKEMVMEKLEGLAIPVGLGFPIGHIPNNQPVLMGQTATLSVRADGAVLQTALCYRQQPS